METEFERIVVAAISVRVNYELLENVVVTALEGGIGWWACLDDTTPEWDPDLCDVTKSEYAARLIANGGRIQFFDETGDWGEEDEPKCPWEVDANTIARGIKLYLESECGTNILTDGELDPAKIDADAASDIFQFGIFGECVFA